MASDVSQRVIRYEGDGKLRRPVYLDEGPASASIARQVGEGKTALLDGLPQRELGGAPRPLLDTIRDTLGWYRRIGYV